MNSLFSLCRRIADLNWFKNAITITILFAGLLIGIETYHEFASDYKNILHFLDQLILLIFIVEILVKILAEGTKPWRYFMDSWNIFDFVIVAAVFMPFGGSSIAILRLLRLLRVLKLVRALPKLQLLVNALLRSIPSMGYVSLLLLLLFYIYAVAAVTFFGENDPVHFSDLQTAMLSLFRVVTLEDWTDIMYINMYGCGDYGYSGIMEKCTNSKAYPLGSALFFVSFVLFGTMIILNLFIGVIMTGMEEAKKSIDEENIKIDKESIQEEGKLAESIDLDGLKQEIKTLQQMIVDLKNKEKD